MRLVAEAKFPQDGVKQEPENQIRGMQITILWQEMGEDGEDVGKTAKGMIEYDTDCRQLPPKSRYGR